MVIGKRESTESVAGAVGETHMIGHIGAGDAQPRGAGAKRSDCVDRPLNHVRDVLRSGLGPRIRFDGRRRLERRRQDRATTVLLVGFAAKPLGGSGRRCSTKVFGPSGMRVDPAEDSCLAELPSHGASQRGLRRGIFGGMALVSNGLLNQQPLAK